MTLGIMIPQDRAAEHVAAAREPDVSRAMAAPGTTAHDVAVAALADADLAIGIGAR